MSLAEQIKGIKLKKTEGQIKDFSNPKLAGFLSDAEITEYQNKVLDVNTEIWLNALSEITFPTEYCPISIDEARIFTKIYEDNFKDKDQENFKSINWRSKLSPNEQKNIDAMIERLEKVMKVFTSKDGHAFVKTSCRSAKDAPMYQEKFIDLYKEELQKMPVEEREKENSQIVGILKAAFQALKMKTAEQVIDTFVTSERIYQDMLLAVKVEDRFHENFVIRKFVEIDVDMEFRGFVYNGILTAVSQYNYLIYSERLHKKKKFFEEAVYRFFIDTVHPILKKVNFQENFIIDFAVCEPENNMKLWVIEINPFMETTDGALFSWQHERHILEGKQGFHFRIIERTKSGAKSMLPQSVKNILKHAHLNKV